MNTHQIHELLERLGNLMRSEARQVNTHRGLQPVQLEALHYLSICNRYSDTLLAVAEYLGLTKGTTSQTLKVLEKNDYLEREKDRNDHRVYHLKVTPKGKTLIEGAVPAPTLRKAARLLSGKEQEETIQNLRKLLFTCQEANGMKSFGACRTCRHNQKLAEGHFCKLTQEPLSHEDIQKICREHQYPSSST